MDMLEREVESKLCRMVERRGGLCLKWVCPGWSGVPDRIILLSGGRVIFAETKRPAGGKISALQRWWAGRLAGLGFRTFFIWSPADVRMLEDVLGEVL